MARPPAPRRLIIDADVARAAGRPSSQDPVSSRCRDYLDCINTETRHAVALSDRLRMEWAEHASHHATRWLALMRSRGRLVQLGGVDDPELRGAVTRHATSDAQRARVLKDIHLVEAARRSDRLVSSRDEDVRRDLRELAASKVTQLRAVVWINPTLPREEPLGWLRSGARNDRWRRLDHDGAA